MPKKSAAVQEKPEEEKPAKEIILLGPKAKYKPQKGQEEEKSCVEVI